MAGPEEKLDASDAMPEWLMEMTRTARASPLKVLVGISVIVAVGSAGYKVHSATARKREEARRRLPLRGKRPPQLRRILASFVPPDDLAAPPVDASKEEKVGYYMQQRLRRFLDDEGDLPECLGSGGDVVVNRRLPVHLGGPAPSWTEKVSGAITKLKEKFRV